MIKNLLFSICLAFIISGCLSQTLSCQKAKNERAPTKSTVQESNILVDSKEEEVVYIQDWDVLIKKIDTINSYESKSLPNKEVPRVALDNHNEVYIYTGRVLGNPYR